MWTIENRRRYDRSRLRYPSDLTDEEWALTGPLIPPAKRGGNKRTVDVREVLNGLMFILSTGCQWASLSQGPAAAEHGQRLLLPLVGAQFAHAIEHTRWRLWHGQVARALDLIGETLVSLDAEVESVGSAAAVKVRRALRDLETYVTGQSDLIIDYATARRRGEPISTATTESTVQWLLHRRMGAQQQMRWSPRGAHLMLKVRTSVTNQAFNDDYAAPERWAVRPFRRAA